LAKAEIFGDDEVSMSNFIFLPQILGGGGCFRGARQVDQSKGAILKKMNKIAIEKYFLKSKKICLRNFFTHDNCTHENCTHEYTADSIFGPLHNWLRYTTSYSSATFNAFLSTLSLSALSLSA